MGDNYDKKTKAKKAKNCEHSAKYRLKKKERLKQLPIEIECYESKLRQVGITVPEGGSWTPVSDSTSTGTRYYPDDAETMTKEELAAWKARQRRNRSRERKRNEVKALHSMEDRLFKLQELLLSHQIENEFVDLGRGYDFDGLATDLNIDTQTTDIQTTDWSFDQIEYAIMEDLNLMAEDDDGGDEEVAHSLLMCSCREAR